MFSICEDDQKTEAPSLRDAQLLFSPHDRSSQAVVENLDHARSNVFVQAYSFTSAPNAKALVDAHRRGVNIQLILDTSQRTEKYSEAVKGFVLIIDNSTFFAPV